MNEPDPSHPSAPPSRITPELESRVVDLVLGETSDFERAEIERVLADSPELQLFRKGIESVHGLLGAGEEPLPWRLADDRRAKVLAAISAPPPPSRSRWWTHPGFRIASVFVVAAAVSLPFLLSPSLTSPAQFALAERLQPDDALTRSLWIGSHLNDAIQPSAAARIAESSTARPETARQMAGPVATGEASDMETRGAREFEKKLMEHNAFEMPHEMPQTRARTPFIGEAVAGGQPVVLPLQIRDRSFRETRAALARKEWPAPETIRIEEFVNAAGSGAPTPSPAQPATFAAEQARHPVEPNLRLLRLGIRTVAGNQAPRAAILLNPDRVTRYRIFGFEPAPGEAENRAPSHPGSFPADASILLELETNPNGTGEIGVVLTKPQAPATGLAKQYLWTVPYDQDPVAFAQSDPRLRTAALAAWTAARLRRDPGPVPDWDELARIHTGLPETSRTSAPVRALGEMLRLARAQ